MAKQTWNVDRKKGGTFSFKLDAQGNYTLQKDGFGSVKTLNLPELKAEDTKTTTTQDTKKISDQTQKAFGDVQPFYYDKKGGGGDQYTSEYQMQKEGDLATDQAMTKGDNFAQARQAMTSDAAYRGVTPSDRQPGFEVANKGIAKQDTTPAWAQGVDKRGYEKIGKDTSIKATDQIGRTNVDKVLAERAQADRFGTGEWGPKPSKGMPQQSPYQDAIMRGQTGVKYEKPGVPQKVSQLTTTALKKVNTGLKPLAKAVGFVMSPVTSTIGMVAGALKEDATQKHAKNYFNAGDDGRIAGNPATDLYAGLNRVSAFGNLEVTGKNRIANRQKTAAKYAGKWSKERMDKFNNTTKEMEKQQDKYTRDKHEAVAKDAISKGAYAHNPAELHAASKKASGNGGSGGGGRVICTYFYSKNQFSLIDLQLDTEFSRNNLSDKVKIGYWFWAIPLVDWMKKHENSNNWWVKLVRNSTKLFAQERAKEIAYTMGKKNKGSLIGKFVRLFGETGCYILGTLIKPFVFDKYKIFLTEYQKDVNLRGRV